MAIQGYFNTLFSVNKFSEGNAPDFEPTYVLRDELYCLLDNSGGLRAWTERGSAVKVDAFMACDSDVDVTTKDQIKIIEDHIIAVADLSGYHKVEGGSWTLTASAAIGTACIFYQATTNTGTGRKADGGVYTIVPPIKNPNMMDRHLELMLEKVGE